MTRSAAWTLTRLWNADFSLADRAHESARLQDLAMIEARVQENLPAGVLTSRDLRDAALRRVPHAPAVLGPVELDRVAQVAPVWRPLLAALARVVPLSWRNPGDAGVAWFAGEVRSDERPTPAAPEVVSCAAPRAEVVEALRWVRELIASGRARPDEILVAGEGVVGRDGRAQGALVPGAPAERPQRRVHVAPADLASSGHGRTQGSGARAR